jgi:predicted CopG family antitoxin
MGQKTISIDAEAWRLLRKARRRAREPYSTVIRRLAGMHATTSTLADVAGDLIGTVDAAELPVDLSARKKHHLTSGGYGAKRPRR